MKLNWKIYSTISKVNLNTWNKIENNTNLFLSYNYLKALEEAMVSSMGFRYLEFYDNDKQVGIAYVQLIDLVDHMDKYHKAMCKIGDTIKRKLLSKLDIRVLVCGNVFTCGENGFLFSDKIDTKCAYESLTLALKDIRTKEKASNPISMMLIKEFWPNHFEESEQFKKHDFKDFKIDVNMVLKLDSSWQNMDDYLNSMVSKFRTKAKATFKKSKPLELKEFSVEDIEYYASEIQFLYSSVLNNADFKFGKLNVLAFRNWKKMLGNKFLFTGYFLDKKLVGFSTGYLLNNAIEAGYVGIDYEYNKTHSLYQKMLCDFVEKAIKFKVEELRFGRTAEVAKSSLGAQPVDMKLYMRHTNSISNKLIKPVIQTIAPSDFELRKPFKKRIQYA